MLRAKHKVKKLHNVKFSVAIEYYDISKSFQVSVWESGRVVCLESDLSSKPAMQLVEKSSALLKAAEILREIRPFVTVGEKLSDITGSLKFGSFLATGQKWVLLLDFWTEIDRAKAIPGLIFRIYKGGVPTPDPSPLVLPMPGMEKEATQVMSHEIALEIAKTVIKSAQWSIESQPMTLVEKSGGL
jgi:hypothetical protein